MSSIRKSKINNGDDDEIGQDKVVKSSVSLVSRPLDGESEQVLNKLICDDIEYETMMAPPFEEKGAPTANMLPSVGNSSSNCDMTRFLGPTNNEQLTDMRNGCDNDLDGNRSKNGSNCSRLVDLDKKTSLNKKTKVRVKKRTEVKQAELFPLSLCLINSSDSNGNQDDELEVSSNHHNHDSISNERRNQEEEEVEDLTSKEGQHLRSPLLLSDNRWREIRGRRRFNSLISSPSSSIGAESCPSQNSPQQQQLSTSIRRKFVANSITKSFDDDEHKQVSDSIEERGGQDWLLSARSRKHKEEEIDELSPLQKVDNKLKLFESRERSSSITSDYFSSSNHESPIIVSLSSSNNTQQQQIGGKKCVLSLFRELASQNEKEKESSSKNQVTKQVANLSELELESEATKRSKIKKSTKIYDNPAFHVNNNNNNHYLQHTYLKTKGNIKEQGNKLFVNKKHLKNEEEDKEKELNKMKEEGERSNKGPQQQQKQNQRENSSSNKSGASNSFHKGINSEEMLKNLR